MKGSLCRKGLSRRHFEGRNTPLREHDPLRVRPKCFFVAAGVSDYPCTVSCLKKTFPYKTTLFRNLSVVFGNRHNEFSLRTEFTLRSIFSTEGSFARTPSKHTRLARTYSAHTEDQTKTPTRPSPCFPTLKFFFCTGVRNQIDFFEGGGSKSVRNQFEISSKLSRGFEIGSKFCGWGSNLDRFRGGGGSKSDRISWGEGLRNRFEFRGVRNRSKSDPSLEGGLRRDFWTGGGFPGPISDK